MEPSDSDENHEELQAELDKAKKQLDDFEKENEGDRVLLKARGSMLKDNVRDLEERIKDRTSKLHPR